MPERIPGIPNKINWKEREKVIEYAIKLGKGYTVYKHPNKNVYDIIRTDIKDQYEPEWVIFQT